MDMPPTPPALEQVVKQELLRCGIRADAFTIEGRGRDVTIVFKETEASAARLDCIRSAVGPAIVEFESEALEQAYEERLFEAARPAMLAHAEAELRKHGALNDFPERSRYDSDAQFAAALERQCRLRPGTFFVQSQWGLIVQSRRQTKADDPRMSCLSAAIMYVSVKGEDFKFGLIGNEAAAPE